MTPPASADASGAALIEALGLTVRFGGAAVLDAVDLSVARGEIVTLIGPNGSGKTTLARAVLGLLSPDAGTVARQPGISVGYVPQQVRIDATLPLTVERFIRLGAAADDGAIKAALEEVRVPRLIGTPMQGLSGGEMRRVLLARALLRAPDLLVLDEPGAGVDIPGQAELYGLIQSLRDRHGLGVLLISHNLHLVMAATDRVVAESHESLKGKNGGPPGTPVRRSEPCSLRQSRGQAPAGSLGARRPSARMQLPP